MKNKLLYIIGAVAIILIGGAIILGKTKERKLNEFMSFSRYDRIPYGMFVSFNLLQYIFPNAKIVSERNPPEKWKEIVFSKPGQALIIVAPKFIASRNEIKNLVAFASYGNDVFISSKELSYNVTEILKCSHSVIFRTATDSLKVSLSRPPYENPMTGHYPGKRFDSYLFSYDSSISEVLGRNEEGRVNFIQFRTGRGSVYVHTAPMVFTNYFILYNSNTKFFSQLLSVIPVDVQKVVWDEYFIKKRDPGVPKKNPGFLATLFKFPAIRYGLLTALVFLLLYVLLEMRRKQRVIPVVTKPVNESLDFVKTIGRLYFDQKDHLNLAKKMSAYFLDHVRNQYAIIPGLADDVFIQLLHSKSGYAQDKLEKIMSMIRIFDNDYSISEKQLITFYRELDLFYKMT